MSQTSPGGPRRPARRIAAIAAVVLVPLAFAGLFAGALSQTSSASDRIPAAIVNSDQLIYSTAADGTKSPIFAGRQLVTELTAGGGSGTTTRFDWTITNRVDAEKALKAGTVDAILTVPKDFSSSILSLRSSAPKRATIAIKTDDAHSYLTGAVAQAVGDGMVSAFGTAITEQYISGMYASVGTLGGSLATAADGASGIATAASGLSGGLGTLSGGVASSADGARSLATGIARYTGGVDSLSAGLHSLDSGAASLGQLSSGVAAYTGSVSQLSDGLTQAYDHLAATDPTAAAAIAQVKDGLAQAAAGGSALSQQASGAVAGIQGGISRSASGAAALAGGSAALRSGSSSLASGIGELATGTASTASGAAQLATGASTLATGLQSGAAKIPAADSAAAAKSAKIAASPVELTVSRDNKIGGIGKAIATFFVPLGLWVGALAVFLLLRPVTGRALSTTAGNARLALSTVGRASAITAAQALLLVALLHLSLGVAWASLPATLGFALLLALAFTAFHFLLTVAFGRVGLVVSLLLLAIQLTSTGGLYPLQLLAAPFQAISPLLPLTYGVAGMQGIISGGDPGRVVVAAIALAVFGVVSILASTLVIRRIRRSSALGLVSPAGAAASEPLPA